MPISLTINNTPVTAPEGATILEAARSSGIDIPTLCHHPDLSHVGACRMCVVSVQGTRALQTACTAPVMEGMVVDTMSDEALVAADCVVIVTGHSAVDYGQVVRHARLLVDTVNATQGLRDAASAAIVRIGAPQ